MRLKFMTVMMLFFTVILFSSSVGAATFSDVPDDHWAKATIDRAVDQGMIKGYPGNRFAPNEKVTVAAFFTMLSRAYQVPITPINKKLDHWADPIYDAMEKYHYPYSKLQQKFIHQGESWYLYRDRPITRYEVAEIIAGADGENYRGDFAIHYILGKGYASGKRSGEISVASYQGKSYLTRAEAVAFIEKLKNNGLKELRVRPQQPSDPMKLPLLPDQEFPDPKEGVLHEVLMDYPGYFAEQLPPNTYSLFRQIQREITPAEPYGDDTKTEVLIHFEDYSEMGNFQGFKREEETYLLDLSQIDIYDIENIAAIQIALDTFHAFEIDTPPLFVDFLKEVKKSKEDKVVPYDGGRFIFTCLGGNQVSIAWKRK